MKRISFFLALALLLASFGLASAISVSTTPTTGTWDDAGTLKIIPGVPVEFDITLNNDDVVAFEGITNGFRVYGPTSGYTPLTASLLLDFEDLYFDLVFEISYFSADGAGSDTVGIGGAQKKNGGLPVGFNQASYHLVTGGVAETETLCLDSSNYPSGTWKWASTVTGDNFPDWDGPHCFLSETPGCLPPINWNGPLSMTGSHCDVMTFDFDADLNPVNFVPGVLVFSADLGTIDPVTGVWSYAPSLGDVGTSMAVTVTVGNGFCSEDHVINLTFTNEAPVLDCPGPTDISTGLATEAFFTATDDCDDASILFSVGALVNATATIADAAVGAVEVTPVDTGAYSVEIIVTDGNAESSCFLTGNAIAGSLYQVEIPCFGGPAGPVYQGQHVSIPVELNNKIIDGYDLLIGYDNSALSFQSAVAGDDLIADGWEYFTYRYGANGNCSNACPTGLLRLTAIAETNNGPNHPVLDGVSELAVLDFLVTNDRTMECQSIPIRFYWMDCGDNALSTDGGNQLHVSEVIYDGDPVLTPPNGTEIQNFDYGFPTYFGTQNVCIVPVGDKPVPIRDVSFNNGCVFIACADAIDLRGDINLNNVANEIADAVLYSNYFIYGIGQFIVNTEGQIAASDVNADGLALSVADLVYLIRVIVGDALPYPKQAPAVVEANVTFTGNTIAVDAEMGAALVVIEGDVQAELLAENMDMISNFDGTNTRVLVFSAEGHSFSDAFLNANGTVVSTEFGSVTGATVTVTAKDIPLDFALNQNYPNPFNPTTTISLALAQASDYTLTIYNVTGQKVAEFAGASEAGNVIINWDASAMASGIYFYKLNAGDFSDTKKMVLLK